VLRSRFSLLLAALSFLVVPSTGLAAGDLEDQVGFPKIALYRAGSGISGTTLAKYDLVVSDGNTTAVPNLDAAKALNPSFVGLIQPAMFNVDSWDIFAATYGAYDTLKTTTQALWGETLRAFNPSTDFLRNPDGSIHWVSGTGTVSVLNWQNADVARWSAKVTAHYALLYGQGHPGVLGIWGDNDLWSHWSYAFTGAAFSPSAWDDGYVIHHRELAARLPAGWIIGGNDISSVSADPSGYKGTIVDGWKLLNAAQAGMKEHAQRKLTSATGLDSLINSVLPFMTLKREDNRQRYVIIGLDGVSATSATARLGLAAACISGAYFWAYSGSSGAYATSFWMTDFDRYGAHWLGRPTGDPVNHASGLWSRTFANGAVIANLSGSSKTLYGVTVPNGDAAFVRGSYTSETSSPAPTPPPPAPSNDAPLLSSFSTTTDSGCTACNVIVNGSSADATVGGGSDSVDTAVAIADFGGSAGWSGRVWSRDSLVVSSSQPLTANLAVLQVRDTSGSLVYEIYVAPDRSIRLWSPEGGLRSSSINASTGIAAGDTARPVEVSALKNDSIVVRVDGVDTITVTGLSGASTGNQRYLAAGIDHYDATTTAESVHASHAMLGASTLGWLGTRTSATSTTP
jgi:hypothetical protein